MPGTTDNGRNQTSNVSVRREKAKKPLLSQTGYRKLNEALSRFLDLVLVLLMMPFNLFILGVIYLASLILHRDGGPFFYRGARLGKNKQEFHMFKIRTLAMGSEQQIGADLLIPGSGRELRLGGFLRTTRLDELPQLFNILKGDMTFVGPRPLRRAVYEKVHGDIPNYDFRFTVKPGLVGYSQLFTPHSTPKRIRSLIDNKFARLKSKFFFDLLLIATTVLMVMVTIIRECYLVVKDHIELMGNRSQGRNQRKMRRISGRRIKVDMTDSDFHRRPPSACNVYDINYEAICLVCDIPLPPLPTEDKVHFIMETEYRKKIKRVRCVGKINWHRKPPADKSSSEYVYVVFYEPVSSLNRYKVDRYILGQSVASIFELFLI
jgi:lipopolysaccharide/colanic/teichoic acid biosynthesis glycosyltransferase